MPPYAGYRRRGGSFRIPGRHFHPANESPHRRIPKDQLLVYDATRGVQQIQQQGPHGDEVDTDSLVLSIGGTCRNPGTRGVRAAWGVYFRPESPYNASALLDAALPQTLARAEIEALRQALSTIEAKFISSDFQPRRCIIKTNSSYIQRVFPSLVRRLRADGGRNVFGEKVVFYELLRDIEERFEDLGYGDGIEGGTDVIFWCVAQEENREADGLAVDALAQPRNGHEERR
ncbi:hypothetical protein TGAMA5MH_10146 [Trichoderma gamsii]|uniref:Uncharacterized protein n=1 Tax=Trichoderma gamsii TaxID=398673 RepID=A0A2K0SXN7_9HYPO|nr:hypothetical protein TGAMA5MH_10146 [Trichoderma gamsii]